MSINSSKRKKRMMTGKCYILHADIHVMHAKHVSTKWHENARDSIPVSGAEHVKLHPIITEEWSIMFLSIT